ncbi:MAG: hypothetical protein ACI39E_07545 [Acutalibacteraceae bacterium]
MKRLLAVFLAIIIMIFGFTCNVSADSYVGRGYMFTFDSSSLNTYFHTHGYYISGYSRATASQSLPWLWLMNYDAGEYLNNSVDPIVDSFPRAKILTICTHGSPGRITCPDTHTNQAPRFTYLVGSRNANSSAYQKAISEQSAFTNNLLTIYIACNSGKTDSVYGNLVSATSAKSGNCAIGWTDNVPQALAADWVEYFFQACYFNHTTASEAADIAATRVLNENPNNEDAKKLENYYICRGDVRIY